ncbi:hypothetical protein HanPI659440_Chr16g0643131 [Helianthus annuus]|nr:hypothetical protein HanPI659440_Chr16g0643131 [Helianthus annuus]
MFETYVVRAVRNLLNLPIPHGLRGGGSLVIEFYHSQYLINSCHVITQYSITSDRNVVGVVTSDRIPSLTNFFNFLF